MHQLSVTGRQHATAARRSLQSRRAVGDLWNLQSHLLPSTSRSPSQACHGIAVIGCQLMPQNKRDVTYLMNAPRQSRKVSVVRSIAVRSRSCPLLVSIAIRHDRGRAVILQPTSKEKRVRENCKERIQQGFATTQCVCLHQYRSQIFC